MKANTDTLSKITGILLVLLLVLSTGAMAQSRALTDLGIQDAVEDELIEDPAVSSVMIDVSTDEGIVTLSGSVDNVLAKDRAEKVAEAVKGVRGVVNNIDVSPSPIRADASIREDINQALLKNPATESFDVEVTVRDNRVTLAGSVNSWQERQLAEKVAKGVQGVKAVINQITVDYQTTRTDGEIKAEIEKTLKWDTLVDHALIDVNVNNGEVRLSGTVGSASEKSQAINDAWVSGVLSVDAADLAVKRWARDEDLRKDKYLPKSDADIAEAVTDALARDPRVLSFNIEADVNAGEVTLRGTVDNLKARQAAAEDARNIVGVIGVENRIKVRPEQESTDKAIEQDLQAALLRDPYVDRYQIDANVINGVAELEGEVDSHFEKLQAEDVAATVLGVVTVDNNLQVKDAQEPYLYDPYVDNRYLYDYQYDYQPNYTLASDLEIKEEINDELWWSPFVDADDVTVTVEDGVATLSGQVDSWSEYSAAFENAYEGGAAWVKNELEVK